MCSPLRIFSLFFLQGVDLVFEREEKKYDRKAPDDVHVVEEAEASERKTHVKV